MPGVLCSSKGMVSAVMKTVVQFTIYALLDPSTLEPRYVGLTRARPMVRFRAHMCSEQPQMRRWIRSLPERPRIRVLAMCSAPVDSERPQATPWLPQYLEQSWIKHLSKRFSLVNVSVYEPTSPAVQREQDALWAAAAARRAAERAESEAQMQQMMDLLDRGECDNEAWTALFASFEVKMAGDADRSCSDSNEPACGGRTPERVTPQCHRRDRAAALAMLAKRTAATLASAKA